MQETDTTPKAAGEAPSSEASPKPKKRHRWLRRILIAVGALILFIILLPVLLYLPPVQDFAEKTATRFVAEKTGN